MQIDFDYLNNWLISVSQRETQDLIKAKLDKDIAWTEEVIIPEIIFNNLKSFERKSWQKCNLSDIYSTCDIIELFGVEPKELNTCFSKKFYKLSSKELEVWEEISKNIDTKLPINDVLIIYSE
tara:strand:+ start:346 stop:714 length:369 start_codon:yes stop_codon:yes gene_type:complete